MTYFSSYALFASVVACGITISWGTYDPKVYDISDGCGLSIPVPGDVRLKLSRSKYLPALASCSVDFLPDTREQLTVKFLSYYMDPAYVNEDGQCPYESIKLLDDKGGPIFPYYNFCGQKRPTANYLVAFSGSFSYNTGNHSNILTADVDLLITEVSFKRDYLNSTCPSSDFDCGNNYCIFKDLTCNGYDDCGNNQDETRPDCSVSSSLSDGAIAGIVVGVVLAIVFD